LKRGVLKKRLSLKKALAGGRVFDSFRAPPPKRDRKLRRRENAGGEKVEDNSKFPLTAKREPLKFPPRHKRGFAAETAKTGSSNFWDFRLNSILSRQ